MSQVRKYQEGGITPIKKDNETQVAEQITPVVPGLEEITLKQKTVPTTEQSKQKPTSYIILDGEKFENNEQNRQKVAQYFSKVADPNGGSKALNQIKDLIFEASQNGYSINYDTPGNELSYIDPTGQSYFIDWRHLNDRKDKRIQKERSWLGRFFDSAFNTDVQQTAEDIYKMRGLGNYLRGNATTETAVDPNLINIDWGDDKFFEYLKDDKGQTIKDENGNLKYNTNSIQNQNLMQILNRINKYLGLQTDDERNQFKLADVWTTDGKLDAIKSIYGSNIEGWKQQYQNIIGKVTSGQQLTPEELSWLELFGISTKGTPKTPEELAADAAEVTKQKWTDSGYESLYDKGKDWFDLGDDNLLALNDIGKTSLGDYLFDSSGNEFNDDWIKYLKSKNADIANYDWLNGYTLYNGKLYKTSSGTDPNSALAKIYSTSGFIDKNKANQYGEAQKIINTFWGNPYEWNTADDSMYSGFTWDPSANNGIGSYRMDRRFRNETGRYSGISSNQQLVSYYDPDAERDYRGMWTDAGQRFAITDEYGDVIADGLTVADLEQRGIKKIIDSAGNEVPYGIEDNTFKQRQLFKSPDPRLNNHTLVTFGENKEFGLYFNPFKSPDRDDATSWMIFKMPEEQAGYVIPATLSSFLLAKNEFGETGLQRLLKNRNSQQYFKDILQSIHQTGIGRLIRSNDGLRTIKWICNFLGIDKEHWNQIFDEFKSMENGSRGERNDNFRVDLSGLNSSNNILSQKQGGIIRKFAPGGGFAKASGSTGKTENTKTKIRDSRELGKAKEIFDWNRLPTHDKAEIIGLFADIASLGMTFIPGVGNLAAAGTGLAGTTAGLVSDIQRDGFQMKDLGNFGINALLDLGSALPGVGTASKLAKTVNKARKVAPTILKLANTYGIVSAIPIATKLANGEDISIRDLRTLVNSITAGVNLSKTGIRNGTKKVSEQQNIELTGSRPQQPKGFEVKSKSGRPEDSIFLTKEEVDQLNSISDIKQKNLKYGEFVAAKKGIKPTDTNYKETVASYDHIGSGAGKLNSDGVLEVGRLSMPEATKVFAPKITFKKADIEKINAGKTPEAKEKVLVDIVKKQPGNEDLDSIEKIREVYDLDNFYKDKRQRSWSLNPKKSIIGEKVTQFQGIPNKSTISSVQIKPTGNKLKDWFNGVGDNQAALRAAIKGEGTINAPRIKTGVYEDVIIVPGNGVNPRNLPVIPQHTLREQVKTSPNWQRAYNYITKKGLGRMHIINPVSNLPTPESAPGVIVENEYRTFAYKKGGLIPKAANGLNTSIVSGGKTMSQDWKTKLAQSAINALPTIGEFGSMVGAIKANNKLRDTLNKGLENPPMVIAPQYNVPRFNDNGVLNEGRQLIKNIYNRQPANYTSDAMLNNFVKKASQEKATEYQNKINNLFSQQLAQHNAKMDEIFYKNRENQIAAQNQNRQTIYANQNAKAKNNAATQISNWQSVDNFVKSRLANLNKQRLAANTMKENLASAKMTAQLLNDTGYTDAKQKYREYITKNPTGVDFDTWLLTVGAGYKSAYDAAIAIARKSNISDQINAANLGLYGNDVQSYADKIFGNNPLYKSGGKVSKSNYRGYRDYKEQIAIDSHKEIRKAIAQLNKDCQQLLLKMLK